MQIRVSWEKLSFWLGREALKLTWPRNCLSNTQSGREVEESGMENTLVFPSDWPETTDTVGISTKIAFLFKTTDKNDSTG